MTADDGARTHAAETMRERAERVLAASEARWRTLLAYAADITWTADAEGVVLSVTSAQPGQRGWHVEAGLGRQITDFVHGDDLPAFRACWGRVLSSSTRRDDLECRTRRSDGSWNWVRVTMTDLRDEPHVRAVVGTVVDIAARRRREELRDRHDRRVRERFESSRAAQVRIELDGSLSAGNRAFCELVERSWEELRGRPVSDLNHEQDEGEADVALALVLAGAQESAHVVRLVSGQDGRPVPVSADISLLRDEHGRPVGATAFHYDLTTHHDSERRREQQDAFFSAIERLAGGLAIVGDVEGQVIYVSPLVTELFGYSLTTMLAADEWDFLHPDDLETARAAYAEVATGGGARTLLLRFRDADDEWLWVEETATHMLDTAIGGIVCTLRDVTERVEAEQALRRSEARYRTFADSAEEGIWAVDAAGSTLYANARMAAILGLPLQDLYDRPAASLLDPEAEQRMNERIAGRSERGTERYEIGYLHPDQQERRLWIVATPLPSNEGGLEGSLGMVSDVTEARRTEQELLHAALHDPLTGLPNRALLLSRLEAALAVETSTTAVLFLDLDRFKFVNDSRGHAFGDQVLVAVADRLQLTAREGDTVARSGGDEFVVVCTDVDEGCAQAVAEDLLSALASPFDVAGSVVHVEASVGIALSPVTSAGDLLRFSDTAMYAAKAAGRGRFRLFDRALTDEAEQRYALAGDLRLALGQPNDELVLHYQPIVNLRTGQVIGLEALARWTHPVHGAIPPTRFVPLAELSGLASDLDRWALSRAFQEAGALRRARVVPRDAYIAVNLSATHLADAGLEDLIVSAAAAAGITSGRVVLEITESAIMNDADVAVGLLRRLRSRGFQVAVDDFGTGYSSLAYLRDLPITHLKIDRSFVTDIADDPDALAVVASIIDLARAVGITAVAEGVETDAQGALLRRLGCPTAQGWLWSKALPVDELRTTGICNRVHPMTLQSAPDDLHLSGQHLSRENGLLHLLGLHRKGASLVTIASALNREGYRTPSNTRWHATSVARAVAEAAYPSAAAAL